MAKKAKRGRPRSNDPAANLSQPVTFRLTKAEVKLCAKAAKLAKLTLRAWLRDRVSRAAVSESKTD